MRYEVEMIDATYHGDTLVELGRYTDGRKRKQYYRTLVLDTSSPYGEKFITKSIRTNNSWLANKVYALLVRRYIRR